MSETVTVAVKFKPGEALTRAVERMKGKIIGQGTHKLYATSETGFAFTLPKWHFPLIIRENGSLAFDDYKGQWGDRSQLNDLQQEYALQAAQCKAEELGLYCERNENLSVTVHFGEGRTITVDYSGEIEAFGFNGQGCDTACEQFAEALGQTLTVAHKQEFYQEHARINALE